MKSAKLFQELSALRHPTDNVAVSPSKSAPMFLSSSVSRFLRSTVRCLVDNLALKCHQETVNRSPDVYVLLSPRSTQRKSQIVSAPLIKGMFANPSPNKSATMSMSLVKCAMMFLKRFVIMWQPRLPNMWMMSSAPMLVPGNVLLPHGKSATMLWSRFQDKPTRLNARLNILKSVANLVVVTETNSLVGNMYDFLNDY